MASAKRPDEVVGIPRRRMEVPVPFKSDYGLLALRQARGDANGCGH